MNEERIFYMDALLKEIAKLNKEKNKLKNENSMRIKVLSLIFEFVYDDEIEPDDQISLIKMVFEMYLKYLDKKREESEEE